MGRARRLLVWPHFVHSAWQGPGVLGTQHLLLGLHHLALDPTHTGMVGLEMCPKHPGETEGTPGTLPCSVVQCGLAREPLPATGLQLSRSAPALPCLFSLKALRLSLQTPPCFVVKGSPCRGAQALSRGQFSGTTQCPEWTEGLWGQSGGSLHKCECAHMHTCIHTSACQHVYVYVEACTPCKHTCTCQVSRHTPTCKCTRAAVVMPTHTQEAVHTHIPMQTHWYPHLGACGYLHTHTHIHTQAPERPRASGGQPQAQLLPHPETTAPEHW